MVNIFDDAKEKVMPSWAKFVNPGDSAQGTYVGKIVGAIDGYGNEQIVYQLLQGDGSIVNVGFGLNKKILHQDMSMVNFGQIVGFKFKGKLMVKDKFGKPVEVKDYGLHQDPKIVDTKWLEENKDNMPKVMYAQKDTTAQSREDIDKANRDFDGYGKSSTADVPFSSEGSLTDEDKLALIVKLASEKLGTNEINATKIKVMEVTGIAFMALNYQKIIDALLKI